MAISGRPTLRASWIRDPKRLLISALVLLLILLLVPLVGLQLLGPVSSGVVSQIQ